MNLVFHIGCEKTGTTSVQSWLHQHSDALVAAGVQYSRVLGRPNNRRISYYGEEPGTPDDGLRRIDVRTAEAHEALQTVIAAEFADEARAAHDAGCKTFVISNEHCHSRLKTDESVERVHALLAPWFDRINVVCFIRPQIDMCLSLASTLARNGGAISRGWMDRELRTTNPYYMYDELLDRWARFFGRDSISPVPFGRHPDSIAFFEQLLGVAQLELPRRRPANQALDYRVIAIVNAISAAAPADRDPDYTAKFFINELPVKQRLTLDRASAQAFQARFVRSNAALCREWPQIHPGDVRPDWQAYPEEGNIDELDMAQELGPFLKEIIERLRLETAMEKARRLAMTSEREMTRGRREAALRACREGLAFARHAVAVEQYRVAMEQIIARLENRLRKIELMPQDGYAATETD